VPAGKKGVTAGKDTPRPDGQAGGSVRLKRIPVEPNQLACTKKRRKSAWVYDSGVGWGVHREGPGNAEKKSSLLTAAKEPWTGRERACHMTALQPFAQADRRENQGGVGAIVEGRRSTGKERVIAGVAGRKHTIGANAKATEAREKGARFGIYENPPVGKRESGGGVYLNTSIPEKKLLKREGQVDMIKQEKKNKRGNCCHRSGHHGGPTYIKTKNVRISGT